jgi:hypothetical protein
VQDSTFLTYRKQGFFYRKQAMLEPHCGGSLGENSLTSDRGLRLRQTWQAMCLSSVTREYQYCRRADKALYPIRIVSDSGALKACPQISEKLMRTGQEVSTWWAVSMSSEMRNACSCTRMECTVYAQLHWASSGLQSHIASRQGGLDCPCLYPNTNLTQRV